MSWIFVAGTVLTVAGTGAQIAANSEADSAVHSARDAEAQRQEKLTKQRQGLFDQSVKDASAKNAQETIGAKTAARENAYEQATVPTGVAAGVAPSAQGTPVAVQGNGGLPDGGAAARSGAKLAQSAWSRLVSGGQAEMGATGDWAQQRNIENRQTSQDLALNQDKARGSLAVNQYEVEQAAKAGDGLRDIGMVASALGSIGMGVGAAGLGAAAAPATSATQVGSAAGETAEAAGAAGATTMAPSFWSSLAGAGTGLGRRRYRY